MRHYILLLLLGLATIAMAQDSDKTIVTHSSFDKIYLGEHAGERELVQYMKQHLPNLSNSYISFDLKFFKESPAGRHFTFQQLYRDIPVYNSEVKVNLDKKGNITSVFQKTYDVSNWSSYNLPAKLKEINEYQLLQKAAMSTEFRSAVAAEHEKVIYFDTENNYPVAALKAILQENEHQHRTSIVISAEGNVLEERPLIKYFSAVDTTITVYVFDPDPITTAQTNYGGVYIDANDTDIPALNAERVQKTVQATIDQGVFKLENPWVKISELSAPNVPIVTSPTPVFDFTRSEPGFEQVNVFYHITAFQKYMQSLGFYLAQYQIPVDVHALSGQDQSQFNSNSDSSGVLVFGEGGVDDAEDADVIIHEYCHAVMSSAAGVTNSEFERNALDEGTCDYFAASYSRMLSEYEWFNIFNWDGHNEFWPGRVANTSDIYPYPAGANIYQAGELWSSALMEAWEAVGGETMDRIVLTAIYSLAGNSTMQEAAQLILQADQTVTGGANFDVLFNILRKRGFLGELETEIAGNWQFLQYKGNLTVYTAADETDISVRIFDIQGRLIAEYVDIQDHIFIIPKEIFTSSGMYFVQLNTQNKKLVEKVIHIER